MTRAVFWGGHLTAHEGEPGRKGREAGRKVAEKMDYCPPSNFGTTVNDLVSHWGGPGWPFLDPCRTAL